MVYYGGVLLANSDLYHHGILGQKWGRRNGPPYPLRPGAHSAGEKRAGYQKSIKGSGGGSYAGRVKKKDYHQYTKITDDMSTEERVKAEHDNNVKARSNAVKAFTNAKKAYNKNMKYRQKINNGKESKITNKERRAAEIMNMAIDQYDEAKMYATKKEIDAILNNKKINDIVVNTVSWTAITGISSTIPALATTFSNETTQEYLDVGKKSKIIDKNKKGSLTGDTFGKSIYSPKEQKTKLDKAKKKDSYDSDFLEQIQNSYILNDDKKDHKKEIDKEYEKYLKDPDKYRERARELKQYGNDATYGNVKEDRKKAKIEKRVREQLAEIKKNNPEQYEKIKKDTIDKGKASEIKYFVDDMNNNELQYVIDRLDKKAKINSLSNKETKTNWDKVKDISDKMKIVADFTNNAANIYNNLSRLAPTEDQNKKK